MFGCVVDGCCKSFSMFYYRYHIRDHHKIKDFKVKPFVTYFSDFEELDDWVKNTLVQGKPIRYYGGPSTGKGKTRFVYHCHRSGSFNPQGKGIRNQKTLGSNKIQGMCPSQIIATKTSSGKIKVEYFEDHFGHTIESSLGRCRMTPTVRHQLADKLGKGLSMTEISEDIQWSGADDLKLLVNRMQLRSLCNSVKKSSKKNETAASLEITEEEDWTENLNLQLKLEILSEEETEATNEEYSDEHEPDYDVEILPMSIDEEDTVEDAEQFLEILMTMKDEDHEEN